MNDSGIHRRGQIPPDAIVSGSFLPVDDKGGLLVSSLKPGAILEIETRNNTYTVSLQPGGEALIWGHPQICPDPAPSTGLGSIYANGVFREGYLGIGSRLSFKIDGKRVNTSSISNIQAKRRS